MGGTREVVVVVAGGTELMGSSSNAWHIRLLEFDGGGR